MRKIFSVLIGVSILVGTASPAISSTYLASKIICLDPGHGGSEPGAVNGSLLEKEINFDVALRLTNLLKADLTLAFEVHNTRDQNNDGLDDNLSLSSRDRYTFCNQKKADIMISLHTNSTSNSSVNGTENYYFHNDDKILAQYLQEAMVSTLWPSELQASMNRGIKKAAFGVLLKSKMPATESEPVFMSNTNEAQLLSDPNGTRRQQIAQAYLIGIENYFTYPPADGGNGNGGGKPCPSPPCNRP